MRHLQPDLLPVSEIEPIFEPLVPIGREVPTATSIIDNLYISRLGYPVMVETKLWRNPEAKREVVAQAIDYGSAIARWGYEQLDQVARNYTRVHNGAELGLRAWVGNYLGGAMEDGPGLFEEIVSRNLRLGRFLTLIVGDQIRDSLVQVLSYVNRYPGLALNVVLVEMEIYRLASDDLWPLLVIPRIVARTEIVEHSVVEVTVTQGQPANVDVRQVKAMTDSGGPSKPAGLTEEAFWELLKEEGTGGLWPNP